MSINKCITMKKGGVFWWCSIVLVLAIFTSCERSLDDVSFDYEGDKLVVDGIIDINGSACWVRISRTQHPNRTFSRDELLITDANVTLHNGNNAYELEETLDGIYSFEGYSIDDSFNTYIEVQAADYQPLLSRPLQFNQDANIDVIGRKIHSISPHRDGAGAVVHLSYTFTIFDDLSTVDRYLVYLVPNSLDSKYENWSLFSSPTNAEDYPDDCRAEGLFFTDGCFNGMEIEYEVDLRLSITDTILLNNETEFMDELDVRISIINKDQYNMLDVNLNVDIDFPIPFFITSPPNTQSNIIDGYGMLISTNGTTISR